MPTPDGQDQKNTTTPSRRRQAFITTGLWLRLILALAIGLLIATAFFATNAISH